MTGGALVGLLWTTQPAEAVDQLFRFGHEVYLQKTDDLIFTPNGDDYFQENGIYRARGAAVVLTKVSDNTLLDFQWLDDNGEAVFSIPGPLIPVKFTLYAQHDVQNAGRFVYVYNDEGDLGTETAYSPVFTTAALPKSTTIPYDVVFDAAISGQEWINVAAIASWTVRRRPSAFPTYADNGAIYKFAMDDPTVDASGEYDPSTRFVRIGDDLGEGWQYKHVIAHELGHALQHWANYPGSGTFPDYAPEFDYDLDDASCPGDSEFYSLVSKEYQSAAIIEGMAHWVSAVAFNSTTEGDCKVVQNESVQWYLNSGTNPAAHSCEGYDDGDSGVEYYFGVFGLDYMHETHGFSPNEVTCTDTTPNTGVAIQLDWERFLWDLITKEGLTFADVVEVFVGAQPELWETSVDAKDGFSFSLNFYHGANPWNNQASRNGVNQ